MSLVVYYALMEKYDLGYFIGIGEIGRFAPDTYAYRTYILNVGNSTLVTEEIQFKSSYYKNDNSAGDKETFPVFAENLEGFADEHFGGKVTDEAAYYHAHANNNACCRRADGEELTENNGKENKSDNQRAAEAKTVFEYGLKSIYCYYIGGGFYSALAENQHGAYDKGYTDKRVNYE